MRCLITGVAGFIGSHLAERLLEEGHEVCGIDCFVNYYPRYFKEHHLQGALSWNTFRFVEESLLSVNLASLLEGVDWVFHLAAQPGVRASWGPDFSRYVDCNVLATQRLLEAAAKVEKLGRFIYASSSSIYGDTPKARVLSESSVPHPASPYGVTKLAAEQLCQAYYHSFAVPVVSLRYFTVYGPRQRPDMAFHRFCKALLDQREIHIYGDGHQTRDFTYISDIVEASLRAARSDAAPGKVINIAGGASVSMQEALLLLQEITGLSVPVIFVAKQYGDAKHTRADVTRAKTLLGYAPQVPLRVGLEEEFAYIRALYTPSTHALSAPQ